MAMELKHLNPQHVMDFTGKDAEDALNKWIRTFKPRIRKIKETA